MRKRFDSILTFHACISQILQSMNCNRQTEIEQLKKAIESAQKGMEMLEADLAEAEKRPEDSSK